MFLDKYLPDKNILKKSNRLLIASSFLNVILIIEIALLIIHNRKLDSALKAFTSPLQSEVLQPGERVEPTKLITLSGDVAEINYLDSLKKYLLFVLSTTCPHCEKNLSGWSIIAKRNNNEDYFILGISISDIEETRKYVELKDVGFYLASIVDSTFRKKYKIIGVPQTILINGYGIVQKSWVGELSNDHIIEIINMINNQTGKL